MREIGSNGEIGIRSVDAKITQTTNPIVKYDQDNRIMVNVSIYLLPYSSQTTILKCTVYCLFQTNNSSLVDLLPSVVNEDFNGRKHVPEDNTRISEWNMEMEVKSVVKNVMLLCAAQQYVSLS